MKYSLFVTFVILIALMSKGCGTSNDAKNVVITVTQSKKMIKAGNISVICSFGKDVANFNNMVTFIDNKDKSFFIEFKDESENKKFLEYLDQNSIKYEDFD